MFHAIFRTSHWDDVKKIPEEPAEVDAPATASKTGESHPEPADFPTPELPATPNYPRSPRPEREKATAAPLIGVGVGFALLHAVPPVGMAVLAVSSAWLLYKSV